MSQTRWHITFGTYADRLHGGERDTVDRRDTKFGHVTIVKQRGLELHASALAGGPTTWLTQDQCAFIESVIPAICERGGWTLIECSAAPNHVHVVLDIAEQIHGKKVRPILKRWITDALYERYTETRVIRWWADGGSNRAVRGHDYRQVVQNYVADQRTSVRKPRPETSKPAPGRPGSPEQNTPAPPYTSPVSSRAEILQTLHHYWGFDSLRPIQEDAIRAALAGRDSLVVMPTGGGKSLCYQLPPLLTNSLTVVVSPLIALMKDQVDGLRLAGVPAAAIHSGISYDDSREILSQLDAGELRLLFLAPERLLTPATLSRLARFYDRAAVPATSPLEGEVAAPAAGEGSATPRPRSPLSFAIDEAHCISQWGHDFRPEYRRLAELRNTFPSAPVHAFTATATQQVQLDIAAQLTLRDPAILVGPFDRPNLTYRVVPRNKADQQCADIAARHTQGESAGATIIYCISRQNTEDLAAALRAQRLRAEPYHAGLDPKRRREVQDDFTNERLDVVVATVAFGMGIDRSNVRCVIHAAMPKSIEHYQQETGRAGRDGLPAECIMLYSPGDAAKWRQILERATDLSGSDERSVLDYTSAPQGPSALDIQLQLLSKMQRFASSSACRHKSLAAYFGQPYDHPADSPRGCNACDACLGELSAAADSTTIARKILSCVARVNQAGPPFGPAHIAHILRGRDTEKILHYRHHQLSTFGLLRDTPRQSIVSYIDQLVAMEALTLAGEFPVLRLTERSVSILKGLEEVSLTEPAGGRADSSRTRTRAEKPAPAGGDLSPEDAALFDSLRRFRYALAKERAIPPYLIFHDTVLRDMARQKPTTESAFRAIRGIGDRKLAEFGHLFADHIAAHQSSTSMP